MRFFRTFALCMVFVGTVVGAGFASGLEIWSFFGKYGIWGFGGVILCSAVISLCGAGIILGVYDCDFTSYDNFCQVVAGKGAGKFFSFLGIVFMYSAFCIMLAGSGALFSQEFGMSYLSGVVFMGLVCFFVFILGIKGLTVVNCLLTPLMLVGITMLGIFSLLTDCRSVSLVYSDLLTVSASGISAIIYVSYNLLSLPPVIISLSDYIPSRRAAVCAGLCGGLTLGICGLLMYAASLSDGFTLTELPALTLAMKHSRSFGIFYGITIYFSMLTTAVGNGYGFLEAAAVKHPNIHPGFLAFLLCASASILALLGFGTLVNALYSAIGYAALLLTFLLVIFSLKKLLSSTRITLQSPQRSTRKQ